MGIKRLKRHQPGATKKEIGDNIERWAKHYLEKAELTLIYENYYSRYGEIDLVMLDTKMEPQTLVFVEVRYRKNKRYGSGAETVSQAKQNKIIKTAYSFLQKEQQYQHYNARFDVVSVSQKEGKLEASWHKNAFQAAAW